MITARAVRIQVAAYGVLLLLIAGNEILDLPHTVFGFMATPINWAEVWIEVGYILGLAVFSIGLTRRMLREIRHLAGLIPVCLHCRKVRDGDQWVSVEEFVAVRSEALVTHGLCPRCATEYARQLKVEEGEG